MIRLGVAMRSIVSLRESIRFLSLLVAKTKTSLIIGSTADNDT